MNHDAKYNLIIKIAKYLFLLLLFLLPFSARAGTITLGSSVKATSIEVPSGATLDVNGSNTLTLTGSGSPFDVQGTFTASTGTIVYAGTAATTIASLSADNHYYNFTLGTADDNNTVVFSINGEIEASGSMTITSGGTGTHTFSQGNYNITVEGASAVSVQANAQWRNIGAGDLILGGTFANAGSVSFDANDSGCTAVADDIQILSTENGVQRTWSGTTGTWNMYNVYVKDMTRTDSPNITVYEGSSSNVTGNWTFNTCAPNEAPTIGEVSLNSKGAINLLENSQIDIMASASVTDLQGCSDISGVKAIVYRYGSGLTASCSEDPFDPNNCYDENQFNCVADGACSGNTQNYNCYASSSMQFFADPTDAGSSFSADEWVVTVIASDSYWEDMSSNSYDDNDETDVEVNTLTALEITAGDPINYGEVIAGQNTGYTDTRKVTIKNTGNRGMDVYLQGTNLTGACGTITVDNQQYASTGFTYDDYGTALTGSNVRYENGRISWIKPTSTTPVTNDIYWGIAVPSGTSPGSCNGTNTFSATEEQ